ncbi:response regulator transcription factor [Paraburkholderia tropica]|uniref:response regulator transcription factor n=1 Tax=Paraburkholderia tropica TaxID=92647 RepID=UPI0032B5B206
MEIHVLVVEPDAGVRDTMCVFFQHQQIRVSVLHGANGLERRLSQEIPSLILMRHDMRHVDGIGEVRRLRESGYSMPILIISGSGDTADKVLAFEVGANDYLVEPFDLHELLARVRHALRCKIEWEYGPQKSASYRFDEYELDVTNSVLSRNGIRIAAPALALDVLRVFASNRARLISRESILNQLDRSPELHARGLDVIVFRLRKLLGTSPRGRQYIQTRHREGYIFLPDDAITGVADCNSNIAETVGKKRGTE